MKLLLGIALINAVIYSAAGISLAGAAIANQNDDGGSDYCWQNPGDQACEGTEAWCYANPGAQECEGTRPWCDANPGADICRPH